MAAADAIRALAARTRDDLDRAALYYADTKMAWRAVLLLAPSSDGLETLGIAPERNLQPADIASLSERYVSGYLAESVFQHYVALAEDYVFGLLGTWLTEFPKGIIGLDEGGLRADEKTVPLSVITDNPDRESMLRAVVDRELDKLKYRRPAEWFAYLESRAKLGAPAKDHIERFTEMKAARDVLVHNRGVINRTYLLKAGPAARFEEDEQIEISEPYLDTCRDLVDGLVAETAAAAGAKLA